MEKWISAMKNDMKMAARTVKSGWKTYFSLFVAIFLVQTLFGIVGISEENARSAKRDAIVQKYDCHIELTNLNDADHYYLLSAEGMMLDPYFEVVPIKTEKGSHTTGIIFKGDAKEQLKSFLLDFEEIFENGAVCNRTPLYDYDVGNVAENVRYVIFLVFLAGVSWILLAILNNVRINHFKFGYGIYMSFGADFVRLSRIIVCEMLYILLLTYLPAMMLSVASVCIMTLSVGGKMYFSFMPYLAALIIPFAVTLFAGIFSVRFLSVRRPSEVMMAQDNSNHVSSPKLTKMIFAERFPRTVENLSLWRFRKYSLSLTASATLFALLFTCGLYVVSFYEKATLYPEAQYTVSLAVPDDAFAAELDAVKGATVLSSGKTEASLINSHVLFGASDVLDAESFERPSFAPDMLATDRVVYRAADAGIPDALTSYYGYEVTGDPSRVLTEDNTLVLSRSLASSRILDVEVGDTVYVALSGAQVEQYHEHEAYDSEKQLALRLQYYSFTYRAFTVAAIIEDEPDRSGLCIYLPKDVYSDMTGQQVTEWAVYMDDDLSERDFEASEKQIRSLVDSHMTATLRDHETRMYRTLTRTGNEAAVYIALFFVILAVVPLIWFFSLILFNRKRQTEFDVYRALGAEEHMIRRLFLHDGVFYGLFGALMYAVAAPLCTYGLFNLLTSDKFYVFFLSSYREKAVYLSRYPDPRIYILGIFVMALSAFLACYFSYRIYNKKQSEHISESFSEEV